tara:strand:- start:258 stop:629 length:372 start_codon:yes stop_codon:yes gene_type:complete
MVKFIDPTQTIEEFKNLECSYANMSGYSDVCPFEIIRVVSNKTLEIREMTAEKLHTAEDLGWVSGGFAGHASNNRNGQKWDIKTNIDYPIIRIRKSKSGQWRSRCGSRFNLSDTPRKHHDYNF